MEKTQLPNANAVLILGILSIPMCTCYGILGLIFGLIALDLAAKDRKLYLQNPDLYTNYENLKVGRVLAIVGTTISALVLVIIFCVVLFLPDENRSGFMENLRIKMEQQQNE